MNKSIRAKKGEFGHATEARHSRMTVRYTQAMQNQYKLTFEYVKDHTKPVHDKLVSIV